MYYHCACFSRKYHGTSDGAQRKRRHRVRCVVNGMHYLCVLFRDIRRTGLGAAYRAVTVVTGLRCSLDAVLRFQLVSENIGGRESGGTENTV